jgi:hypothetical protein
MQEMEVDRQWYERRIADIVRHRPCLLTRAARFGHGLKAVAPDNGRHIAALAMVASPALR